MTLLSKAIGLEGGAGMFVIAFSATHLPDNNAEI